MKRALFISYNLIGDGLYISPSLRLWHQQNPDCEIDLLTRKDHVTRIYSGMGVPVNVITEESELREPYDFRHTFDVSKAFGVCDTNKCHVSDGYALLLFGQRLPPLPNYAHLGPFYSPEEEDITGFEQLCLVSMFSASCTSRDKTRSLPPNKMLPWSKWPRVLDVINSWFQPEQVKFLGAPEDRAPELAISEDQYMTGIPLNRLALIMKKSQLVLTLDNGMGHLAASQKAKQIVFYPECLGPHYIVPWGNMERMRVLQFNPATVDSGMVANSVNRFIRELKNLG